jgi:hypothetical protein
MGRVVAGIAATLILGFVAPAVAQTIGDEIQNEEQPGSEIQINLGGGGVQVERENGAPIFPLAPFRRPASVFPLAPYTAPAPVFPVAPLAGTARPNDSVFPVAPLPVGSNQLRPLDDPDAPIAGDPIDRELPGEGPEDLSGPDDDNPLPE